MIFGRNKTIRALEIKAEFSGEEVTVKGRDFQRQLSLPEFLFYLAGVAAHNANNEACGVQFRTVVVPYINYNF